MSQNLSSKFYSNKQEKLLASSLGWSVVSGSGARNLYPGDIESEEWLGECKTHTTPNHKIVFYQSVWDKISDEAISKYRFPALFVDDGSQTTKHTWVLFKSLPAKPFEFQNYPYDIKSNISFKSLDMLKHIHSLDASKPIIFKLRKDRKILYICRFDDFVDLFT